MTMPFWQALTSTPAGIKGLGEAIGPLAGLASLLIKNPNKRKDVLGAARMLTSVLQIGSSIGGVAGKFAEPSEGTPLSDEAKKWGEGFGKSLKISKEFGTGKLDPEVFKGGFLGKILEKDPSALNDPNLFFDTNLESMGTAGAEIGNPNKSFNINWNMP